MFTVLTQDRSLIIAVVIAILARLVVFAFTAVNPALDDNANPVSPSLYQTGGDISNYVSTAHKLFERPISDLYHEYRQIYTVGKSDGGRIASFAPLFPALIYLLDYREGNTWPMAILYLACSVILVSVWLYWLKANGISGPWLVAFAVLPSPIWFTMSVTTDLPFALLFALFFVTYFRQEWGPQVVVTWGLLLVLILLARPNGLAVLVFVLADVIVRTLKTRGPVFALGTSAVLFAAVVASTYYYFPQFLTFVQTSAGMTFFGVPAEVYVSGLFSEWPVVVDRVASVLILIGAKALYFVGLRPSYSDQPFLIVLVRAAPGLILLPGLIIAVVRGSGRMRMLLLIFCLPILIGASQDRYNLPIQPILFCFGAMALKGPLERIVTRRTLVS